MKLERRSIAAAVTLATALCAASPAVAQNQSVAETLFREGRDLFRTGKTDEACAKLAESQKQDPALGTLILLATCHEKQGKVASAWGEYQDASVQASRQGQVDRETYAQEHAVALEEKVHHLRLTVRAPVADQELRVDDKPIGAAAWTSPLPIDPGPHVVWAKAPGRLESKQTIEIPADAGESTLEVAPLPIDPDAGKRDRVVIIQDRTSRRNVGYALGAAGIVALAGSLVLELRARSLYDDSTALAEKGDSGANAKYDSALTLQTLSIITAGLGVVSLGTATYLVLTSRKDKGAPPTVGGVSPALGVGYAGLRGVF